MKHTEISWAGERLVLLPERALWWPREKTLFIADPHFGKAATFRLAGIPVPETSQEADLERLKLILHRHRARRLVILGDFFHAKSGRSQSALTALEDWRAKHEKLEIILIAGNHDRHAGAPPVEWNIKNVSAPWPLPPFVCHHHPPMKKTGAFVLAGHVHPAFRIYERGGLKATSQCFHFSERVATLPAFGGFTGNHIVKPEGTDRVFIIGDEEVIDVSRLIKVGR